MGMLCFISVFTLVFPLEAGFFTTPSIAKIAQRCTNKGIRLSSDTTSPVQQRHQATYPTPQEITGIQWIASWSTVSFTVLSYTSWILLFGIPSSRGVGIRTITPSSLDVPVFLSFRRLLKTAYKIHTHTQKKKNIFNRGALAGKFGGFFRIKLKSSNPQILRFWPIYSKMGSLDT